MKRCGKLVSTMLTRQNATIQTSICFNMLLVVYYNMQYALHKVYNFNPCKKKICRLKYGIIAGEIQQRKQVKQDNPLHTSAGITMVLPLPFVIGLINI